MGAAEVQRDEVGQTLASRYLITHALGDGGTAAVYAVRDLRLERNVALKRGLPSSKARQSQRKALLEREFHTLAQLAHPSIIEVYDYGVDEYGAYYTMELLDGQDLHKQGRVPWRQACALLRDVASSLALLHSRGLIHRDVSARNVRHTADGRAKLIDFGAMTAMGVAKDVVGTPPFLAPEVLQMQSLDGRADLFSLGALGYYLLSGTHAYPARKFRDLRDAWRSRPAAVSRWQPEMPAGLNALIMQLLSLDRGARPQAAAEVMQRLCALADLPMAEDTLVSRAYLTTPTLIGRDAALIAVRRRMLGLARSDGGTLLVQGGPGTGRSRLLDACALEAKLVGAAVLRADASDERTDWSAVRVLGRQLVQLLPEAAAMAARLSREVLGQVIDELRGDVTTTTAVTSVDRSLLIRELRDFFLALARIQRLVIVVDDADQIDEPSAALLAALAHKTERHPLVIVVAIDREANSDASASMRLLRLVADPIEIDALAPEQSEALLRSVFGDVPGLSLVAGRIHTLSQGKPANILEFAQHLADRGLARYEAGTWSLPLQLGERDLPSSLTASLAARIGALGSDAVEICEALCLGDSDSDVIGIADYSGLTSHGDPRRVSRALDELVIARILVADPDRHRFSQRGFIAVLESMIAPARRHWLHNRLADMLAASGGDVLRRAGHLLQCGREREAVDLLTSVDLRQRPAPLPLLARVVEAAVQLKLPAGQIHAFRNALLHRAALDMSIEEYRQHAPILFGELERDTGLLRYRELSELPHAERLVRALEETKRRYDSLPEDERVLPIVDAVRSLAGFCALQRSMALSTFDLRMMEEELPSLAPLASLSPVLAILVLNSTASNDSLRGRFQRAREGFERIVSRLGTQEESGLLPAEYVRARCGMLYVLGLIDAGRGVATAEQHAAELERERSYQVNAWRIRMLLHLTRGDAPEAARCRRRAELAVLRDGLGQQFAGTTAFGELQCHVLSGDLAGINQANRTIAHLASSFEGWRPFLVFGQCSALRLQGNFAGALALLEPVLQAMEPGSHASYACLAACHVQLLCDLNRIDEAALRAEHYLAISEREDLSPAGYVVHVAASFAFARAGNYAAAVKTIEEVIVIALRDGHGGVAIGSMYEARARIAAMMNDGATFRHYVQLCTDAYQHGKNPHLAIKLAMLYEEARHGDESEQPFAQSVRAAAAEAETHSEYSTLHSRMLECVDETDRARCALTMLLQQLDSFTGYLYGVNETDHVLLAALPEDEVDSELGDWFAKLLAQELEPAEEVTGELNDDEPMSGSAGAGGSVPFRYTDARGRVFEPLFLTKHSAVEQRLAAVLLYEATRDTNRRPSRELQDDLAEQLINHGDVTGALFALTEERTNTH
jgi:hypothetical protein